MDAPMELDRISIAESEMMVQLGQRVARSGARAPDSLELENRIRHLAWAYEYVYVVTLPQRQFTV